MLTHKISLCEICNPKCSKMRNWAKNAITPLHLVNPYLFMYVTSWWQINYVFNRIDSGVILRALGNYYIYFQHSIHFLVWFISQLNTNYRFMASILDFKMATKDKHFWICVHCICWPHKCKLWHQICDFMTPGRRNMKK